MEQQIKEYDSLIDLLEDLDREGITGARKNEEYKKFLNFQARMRGQAHSGSFELAPLCNFDCKMCYVHLTKAQMEQEARLLSTEQWIDIIHQAIDAGMMQAVLTGGECLSYPGFKEIYLYLFSQGIEVSILTNGQLISEEIADLFAIYPPTVVQLTIYGSDEDSYEAVTGRRAFADVCAAIDRLKKRSIRTYITITPNRYMQKNTHELLEFIRSLGVQYGIGAASLPARENTGRALDDYAAESDLYARLTLDDQAYNKAETENEQKNVEVIRIPRGFKPSGKLPCSSGQCTFHINWKGEMQPCIPYYTVTKSVLRNGFDDCWEWIKKVMQAYEVPQECKKCPYESVCLACPGEQTMGRLNGPVNKVVCDRCKSYVQAGILRVKSKETGIGFESEGGDN